MRVQHRFESPRFQGAGRALSGPDRKQLTNGLPSTDAYQYALGQLPAGEPRRPRGGGASLRSRPESDAHRPVAARFPGPRLSRAGADGAPRLAAGALAGRRRRSRPGTLRAGRLGYRPEPGRRCTQARHRCRRQRIDLRRFLRLGQRRPLSPRPGATQALPESDRRVRALPHLVLGRRCRGDRSAHPRHALREPDGAGADHCRHRQGNRPGGVLRRDCTQEHPGHRRRTRRSLRHGSTPGARRLEHPLRERLPPQGRHGRLRGRGLVGVPAEHGRGHHARPGSYDIQRRPPRQGIPQEVLRRFRTVRSLPDRADRRAAQARRLGGGHLGNRGRRNPGSCAPHGPRPHPAGHKLVAATGRARRTGLLDDHPARRDAGPDRPAGRRRGVWIRFRAQHRFRRPPATAVPHRRHGSGEAAVESVHPGVAHYRNAGEPGQRLRLQR